MTIRFKSKLAATLSVLALMSLPLAAETTGPGGEAATPSSAVTLMIPKPLNFKPWV